jgi:hypothetical protein
MTMGNFAPARAERKLMSRASDIVTEIEGHPGAEQFGADWLQRLGRP